MKSYRFLAVGALDANGGPRKEGRYRLAFPTLETRDVRFSTFRRMQSAICKSSKGEPWGNVGRANCKFVDIYYLGVNI